MLKSRTHNTVARWILSAACVSAPLFAASPLPVKVSGTLSGIVSNAVGIPQMGATVMLFNRQEKLIEKIMTNERGEFGFLGLFPEAYSVKVTMSSFVPAFRRNILVQPGMRSVLNVNLNSLFSTIQLSYPTVDSGSLVNEEWKWVLRSAPSTRSVMRFADPTWTQTTASTRTAVFSDTRGMLKVSAGDGAIGTGVGSEGGLGTAFALATSLYGSNQLEVSGGYGSMNGVPTAGFHTSISRSLPTGTPEISLTMRQLFLPARMGAALAGNDSAMPMLRTMSAGFEDHMQVAENIMVQYGFTMDGVTFLDHLSYFSPYARLEYTMSPDSQVEFAYTSGNARPDLAGTARQDAALQHDLNTLALFPNITMMGGRAKVQRGEEFEVTYTKRADSRTYSVSAYRETVSNTALSIVAPDGLYAGGDILPDMFSGNSLFNAGSYQSTGYTAGVTQKLGEHVDATVSYGSLGALAADRRDLRTGSPDELRAMIHASRRHAATARISVTAPHAGTHMIASYQWTNDHRAVLPGNLYSTQAMRPMPGLNIYIRQPIPVLSSLPWRVEATADLRNMLAQGYLPLNMTNGQQVLLVETPRSVRGGLSFIF